MDVVLGVSWTAPGSAMEAGALLVEQQSLWPRTHLKMNPMGKKNRQRSEWKEKGCSMKQSLCSLDYHEVLAVHFRDSKSHGLLRGLFT